MSSAAFLAVGVGGALGALCRSKATTYLKSHTTQAFPWPTLAINIASCTAAGALLFFQLHLGEIAYLALTMGFLGGFSTLSTMNYEAVELLFSGKRFMCASYLGISYLTTLGAAAAGFALASLA